MSEDNLDILYKTFGENICLFPFMSMFLTTWANDKREYSLRPCTVGNLRNANIPPSPTDLSIADSYNNDYWVNLRKNHFDNQGLDHSYCQGCKRIEQRNAMSSRKANNRHFIELFGLETIDVINRIKNNSFKINLSDILSIEYMPSNYCNFACIMCNPNASSKRKEQLRKMGIVDDSIITQGNNPIDFYDLIQNVKLLNFTGGETLLQPEVIKLIDKMIELDKAKDIKISILSNVSTYKKDIYDKLEKFQSCFMVCSLDGTDNIIEYQRIGANWNKISANVLAIHNNHQIGYVINYVVTAVSVIGIPNFIKWIKDNKIAGSMENKDQKSVTFSPVFNTLYLDINALPTLVIKNVLNELYEMKQKATIDTSWENYKIIIDDAIAFIETHSFDIELTKILKEKLSMEDLARNDGLKYTDVLGNILDEY